MQITIKNFMGVVLMCAAAVFTVFAQREVIQINDGWKFAVDKSAEGLAQQWYLRPLPGARLVNLPHTWNVEDDNQMHYGWGWYQKTIAVPAAWRSKNVVLHQWTQGR